MTMTKWIITVLVLVLVTSAINNCASRTVSRARAVRDIRTRAID